MNRAVTTGTKSQYNTLSDLKGTTIGISRNGRYFQPLIQDRVDDNISCNAQRKPNNGLCYGSSARMAYK